MNKEFKVIDFIADGENARILKVQNLSDLKYYAIKIIYRTKDNIQYINNEINILRKIRNKITKIRNNLLRYYRNFFVIKNNYIYSCILSELLDLNLLTFVNKNCKFGFSMREIFNERYSMYC